MSNLSSPTASRIATPRASTHQAGSCSRVPSSRSTISCGARPTATTSPLVGSRSTTLVACVPQSTPRKTRRIWLPPRVVTLRECPCVLAADRTQHPAGEVVGLHVDPAEEARLSGLIGGVVIGCPLKHEVGARAVLDLERAGWDGPLGGSAGEGLAARGRRGGLGRGPAERAVTGDVSLEGRGHEGRQLVRHPGRSE